MRPRGCRRCGEVGSRTKDVWRRQIGDRSRRCFCWCRVIQIPTVAENQHRSSWTVPTRRIPAAAACDWHGMAKLILVSFNSLGKLKGPLGGKKR